VVNYDGLVRYVSISLPFVCLHSQLEVKYVFLPSAFYLTAINLNASVNA
jgi:hypothetical protein